MHGDCKVRITHRSCLFNHEEHQEHEETKVWIPEIFVRFVFFMVPFVLLKRPANDFAIAMIDCAGRGHTATVAG